MADSIHTDRLGEFIDWAKENNLMELEDMMPNGSINPEGDRPQRWESVLLEWKKNNNPEFKIP